MVWLFIPKQPYLHSLQTTHWMELGESRIVYLCNLPKRGDLPSSNGYPLNSGMLGSLYNVQVHVQCILRPDLVLCFTNQCKGHRFRDGGLVDAWLVDTWEKL